MGDVYRARDTRLGRTVAIKVLPADAASDPERRRRFEQEARAVSALNHPHICVLHDVGREGETDFLVMEHLEGQTLAHRLRKGPVPFEQALDLGAAIADALAAAHRAGIVHRDLKPANVMLVKSGAGLQAKLLDFGLAKLKAQPAAAAAGISALSTEGPATTPGAILGTVPYMAPEQLEGKEADARTDLFAFGCVLYEMLTGRRAFAGETEASVISAIMTGDPPPVSSLQPVAPPALERLVKACLAKDPDARRQSAHDVAEDLRGIAEGVQPAAPPSASRIGRAWVIGLAAALTVLAAIVLLFRQDWWTPRPVRTDIMIPEGQSFIHGDASGLAFAPGGNALVYHSMDRAQLRAHLNWQDLDGSPPRAIPGTDGGKQPFFSPDGRHLGFTLGAKLVKMALPSGRPGEAVTVEPLADIGWMRGASWGQDGSILYTPRPYAGLWRVSADGGGARELTRPDHSRNEWSHRWPCFLPGGRAALFTVFHASSRQDRSAIAVLSLDTGRWHRVIERGSCARYLPTGHVVFARNGALLAVRFDPGTLTAVGQAVPVATGVSMAASGGAAYAGFDVSASGTMAFAPAKDSDKRYVGLAGPPGSRRVGDARSARVRAAPRPLAGWTQARGDHRRPGVPEPARVPHP